MADRGIPCLALAKQKWNKPVLELYHPGIGCWVYVYGMNCAFSTPKAASEGGIRPECHPGIPLPYT